MPAQAVLQHRDAQRVGLADQGLGGCRLARSSLAPHSPPNTVSAA